jgi:hypothetical protein
MQETGIQSVLDKPLFTPSYLNIEYIFTKIVEYGRPVLDFIIDKDTWSVIGVISSILSIVCLAIIIFSLVRMFEIQAEDRRETDKEIRLALQRRKERERNANPRWHYIQTLIESSNQSDWRVAIIEADSLMEEILKERGIAGNTVSELLEGAKSSGYMRIQDAWDAHIVRNQIAHQGSDFSLSQVEGRRVIKLYQNFFEELRVI